MIKFTKTGEKYGCFSNFFLADVDYEGLHFTSTEAAFQAQKCLDEETKKSFQTKSPSAAKLSGRKVKLRPDWESVKYNVMRDVCYAKFSQNPGLKEILLSTNDEEIVENTTGWHDNIWGNCDCVRCKNIVGQNLLGKALMEVREKLRK